MYTVGTRKLPTIHNTVGNYRPDTDTEGILNAINALL